MVSAALTCCAVYGTGVRDSLFLDGTWTAVTETGVSHEVVLPGTADENRLGTRNPDTSCTSGLTRLYPFEGVVTYTKSVRIPRSFSGKRLRLVLERTKPSVLRVDGDSIGSFGHILINHSGLHRRFCRYKCIHFCQLDLKCITCRNPQFACLERIDADQLERRNRADVHRGKRFGVHFFNEDLSGRGGRKCRCVHESGFK